MKRLLAIAAVAAGVATGCDSPVSPTIVGDPVLTPGAAPFRNFAESVPERPDDGCVVRAGCCFDRRPHRHCR
jgi:hypothetical protein